MTILPTPLAGLMVVETGEHRDLRGRFSRLYCANDLADLIGARRVIQINQSVTQKRGAVRGMHFQYPPYAEMKLVRCIRGSVWDVAVDLRKASPSFLHWHAEELTAENRRMMVIPEGFAHGFQAMTPNSELLYLHTAPYTADAEGGLRLDDPRLGIRWPLPLADVSDRDAAHPLIDGGFDGVDI